MAIEYVNIGSYSNDGTGDDLRTAFEKVNSNFEQLSGTIAIQNGVNVGTGASVFKTKNLSNLEFKTLTSTDNSVTIGVNENTIDLTSFSAVEQDETPKLGGNLDLNGFNITGIGNIGAPYNSPDRDNIKVNGIKVLDLVAVQDLMLWSQTVDIDLGTVTQPVGGDGPYSGINLDMGVFSEEFGGPSHIQLNFGFVNVVTSDELKFSDGTVQTTAYQKVAVPTASTGKAGDKAGMVAYNSSYTYYCTGTYDGTTNIWKRVAWSVDTW
jgi:hypothetical protein